MKDVFLRICLGLITLIFAFALLVVIAVFPWVFLALVIPVAVFGLYVIGDLIIDYKTWK